MLRRGRTASTSTIFSLKAVETSFRDFWTAIIEKTKKMGREDNNEYSKFKND